MATSLAPPPGAMPASNPDADSLKQRLMWALLPVALVVTLVTAGLSFWLVHQLEHELDLGLASLTKAVAQAAGHAHVTHNQDVLKLLREELRANQGVEVLLVAKDGRDMLTDLTPTVTALAAFDRRLPIYDFPGNAPPREVGTAYFRRLTDFWWLQLGVLTGSILAMLLALGLTLRAVLQREVVEPIDTIMVAIRGYAENGFDGLGLVPDPTTNREFQELSEVIMAMDHSLHEFHAAWEERAIRQALRESAAPRED